MMENSIHPARTISFDKLFNGLEAACDARIVHRKNASDGRVLYCYTKQCVYEKSWNEYSLLARGLILHPETKQVIATPFPKFFNVGEMGKAIPNLPFEIFEKVDGSLIIIHYFNGSWYAATKGLFDSRQAKWAEERLNNQDISSLIPGYTYLAEAIYPENRIVVRYKETGLILLGAYASDGRELFFDEINETALSLGWRTAKRYQYASFADLMSHADQLPATEEGFVIRFSNGLRLKIKGAEYRRIHSLISKCTPLDIWECMMTGIDLDAIRRDMPEEFWIDFDSIVGNLQNKISCLMNKIKIEADKTIGMTDKEVGLVLDTIPKDVRSFIFPYRKSGRIEGKTLDILFRSIRPTGNVLEGYKPSHNMLLVSED